MKRKKLPILPVLGICLILISLSWMILFQLRVHTGVQQREKILLEMNRILPERTAGMPDSLENTGMPVLEIEGTDYVAILEIPSFEITLPVADNWEGRNLSALPARFSGSAREGTLIIGGADDSRQFGFCDKIEHGALITVTDMTGVQSTYTVSRIDRAKHAETQWLMDSDCALTFFCHDVYSMEYIAVRCDSACN